MQTKPYGHPMHVCGAGSGQEAMLPEQRERSTTVLRHKAMKPCSNHWKMVQEEGEGQRLSSAGHGGSRLGREVRMVSSENNGSP